MLLCSKLFYCLWLPIHIVLEGGDPNAMLEVIKARRVNAALQQTLFIVFSSLLIQCKREVTQVLFLGHESPEDNAA